MKKKTISNQHKPKSTTKDFLFGAIYASWTQFGAIYAAASTSYGLVLKNAVAAASQDETDALSRDDINGFCSNGDYSNITLLYLLDMYTKCSGMNVYGEEAIIFLCAMEIENMTPDEVTFVGLLSGYSHSGLHYV
ncbi:hypothetical protein Vadar_003286 [Vaccinium darrowii]|uniref:Uncharacterized protein n=1 Tax=Vaccinium darrowii TaxID=229202 RepID=A0ACB7X7U9_9ERIC|nr:hypothetical protein Vadar_003286 [Vaccinium darrowii]